MLSLSECHFIPFKVDQNLNFALTGLDKKNEEVF